MKRWMAASWLLAAPAMTAADQVFLQGGGQLSGVIVERSSASVVLEVGPGRVTLPLARVERIVEGESPLSIFQARARRLSATDTQGWIELGFWARASGLLTQAREAFGHVLSLDPANPTAHQQLGDVQLGDRWVTPEESFRARGLVPFEGAWVTPEERSAALRERAEAEMAESARAEAEARAREAEARAAAAEAEARRAEADARRAEAAPVYGPQGLVVGLSPPVRRCLPAFPPSRRHAPPRTRAVPRPMRPETTPVLVEPSRPARSRASRTGPREAAPH